MLRIVVALFLLLAPSGAAQMELRLDLEPLAAEIGQPVAVILTAEHLESFKLELPSSVLPDDSWLLLEDAQKLTLPHPKRDGLVVTVVRWQVASLEPGERVFEFPDVRWSDGSSAGLTQVTALTLKVAGSLAEGEDSSRPALTFREPAFPPTPISRWPWGAASVGAVLVVWLLWKRKGRAQSESATSFSPRARLDTLEARSAELGVRGSFFELSALVRGALDEGGEDLAGLTDEEWLAARGEDVRSSEQEREVLGELLARCAEVKYGQAEPTRWALEESLKAAQELARSANVAQPEVAA